MPSQSLELCYARSTPALSKQTAEGLLQPEKSVDRKEVCSPRASTPFTQSSDAASNQQSFTTWALKANTHGCISIAWGLFLRSPSIQVLQLAPTTLSPGCGNRAYPASVGGLPVRPSPPFLVCNASILWAACEGKDGTRPIFSSRKRTSQFRNDWVGQGQSAQVKPKVICSRNVSK